MFSKPKIIVASDFSENSDNALKAAEMLRRNTDGSLFVIHVTADPERPTWTNTQSILDIYTENYKDKLTDQLMKNLEAQILKCGIQAKASVLLGSTVPTIVQHVKSEKADLLVLGHKHEHRFFHLGHIGSKIISEVSVPVMIAKKDIVVERIAALVDPGQTEEKVFQVAEELAYLCSGQLELVSVFPEEDYLLETSFPDAPMVIKMTDEKKRELKDQMKSKLEAKTDPHTAAKVKVEIAGQDTVKELVRILVEDDIQLAVMAKHHKRKFEDFLLGSVTKGVFENWRGNLLILPAA